MGDILGGRAALGGAPQSDADWHRLLERGLPYRVLRPLARWTALSDAELGGALGIPRSTLSRRKQAGRFSTGESDRIYRTARLLSLARLALGTPENTSAWLSEPNHALGGATPLSLMRTEAGARQIESVLGRFLFGGYS
ncbi:MAG: DUF2384 domain-containing protein [Candidatus Eremiobacteraeota bacterium]|nr:DUF2384 domain-containing protein [Candidatus Eremiobacteraeota bacterium]